MQNCGFHVGPTVCNYMLEGSARVGCLSSASRWFSALEPMGTPHKAAYHHVIEASVKEAKWGSARQWLSAMVLAGIKPCRELRDQVSRLRHAATPRESMEEADVWAWTFIIRTCAAVGSVKLAVDWLKRMIRSGVEVPDTLYDEVTMLSSSSSPYTDLSGLQSIAQDNATKAELHRLKRLAHPGECELDDEMSRCATSLTHSKIRFRRASLGTIEEEASDMTRRESQSIRSIPRTRSRVQSLG